MLSNTFCGSPRLYRSDPSFPTMLWIATLVFVYSMCLLYWHRIRPHLDWRDCQPLSPLWSRPHNKSCSEAFIQQRTEILPGHPFTYASLSAGFVNLRDVVWIWVLHSFWKPELVTIADLAVVTAGPGFFVIWGRSSTCFAWAVAWGKIFSDHACLAFEKASLLSVLLCSSPDLISTNIGSWSEKEDVQTDAVHESYFPSLLHW